MIPLLSQPGTVLLDASQRDAQDRRSLLFSAPSRVLRADSPGEVPALLRELDRAVADGTYVAGYLGYEAGYALDRIVTAPTVAGPLGWFGVYDAPQMLATDAVDRLLAEADLGAYAVTQGRFDIDRAAYLDRIAAIKAYIRDGDVYQVNFTGAYRFDFTGASTALYRDLRRKQRVSYGAFLNTGEAHLLCLSPELFFRRDGDRLVTRPMKGTVRRGRTHAEDEQLRAWLAQDAKSRAENLMIVDLLRNDLSICCRPGTVRVPALFTTEKYETLFQMTSTVEGRLQEGLGYEAIFRALFPCGSVTGAPKIRAMQVIHALEDGPRGVYCGAIGYIAPNREAVFNVAIRTILLQDGHGVMGIGSGVVWDSDAGAEYDECLLKAQFLTGADRGDFELIETMRWEGAIRLLDLHIGRLRGSAHYFGFPFEEARFREAVAGAAAGFSEEEAYKVRATLDRSGRLSVTTHRLAPAPVGMWCVVLAEERIDTEDLFFYHKTTRRDFYEAAFRRAQAQGYDEVLFLNERGEVAEGSRTNVFIRKGDTLYTPPAAAGLLGGVYRRHLLEVRPNTAERVLYPKDLLEADGLYLCNAVWGLQAATLRP